MHTKEESQCFNFAPILCAQYITREDELWMRGLCPYLRSMPISVYAANLVNSNHLLPTNSKIITPCMSFVCQTDTYDTLLARIMSVALVSDEDVAGSDVDYNLMNLKMYAVKNSTPYLLLQEVDSPESSIWHIFSRLHPKCSYDAKKDFQATAEANSFLENIPELGILQQPPEKEGTSILRYFFTMVIILNLIFYILSLSEKEKANRLVYGSGSLWDLRQFKFCEF